MLGTAEGRAEGKWRIRIFGRHPKRTLLRVWLWAVGINLVFHTLMLPITVAGSSMTPTYESGSRNLVNKVAYLHRAPQRGDVVVIRAQAEDELLIKRIVGLPGDLVSITDGHLEINRRPLDDAYAYMTIPWSIPPIQLERNQYFYIGDNRPNSVYGLADKSDIVGKVMF